MGASFPLCIKEGRKKHKNTQNRRKHCCNIIKHLTIVFYYLIISGFHGLLAMESNSTPRMHHHGAFPIFALLGCFVLGVFRVSLIFAGKVEPLILTPSDGRDPFSSTTED